MARNLISSGSMEDMDTYNNANHGGGGDNPPSGGVLSPEPEKVERTRDWSDPNGSTFKNMTPEEKKLPVTKSASGRTVNMGSSDPGLTPPIHERTVTPSGRTGAMVSAGPGTGIANLDAMHDQATKADPADYAAAHPGRATPVVNVPASFTHADPFSNPNDFKSVPGTSKMEYAPGGAKEPQE
jgi:hypothetical protein